jgi:siderophore synthetase component
MTILQSDTHTKSKPSTLGSDTDAPAGVRFRRHAHGIGELALRQLRIPEDVGVVHSWVTQDYARFWGMQGLDVSGVQDAYRLITAPVHAETYLGLHDGKPAFLVETYHPRHEPLAAHYDAQASDRGMHVLLAPAEHRLKGFSWEVFKTVMDFLFQDASVRRVVVEPDVRNERIQALNLRAGFVPQRTVDLTATSTTPAKTALLSFCSRADYLLARARDGRPEQTSKSTSVAPIPHFHPNTWLTVNRALVRKILAEFSHERLIQPVAHAGGNETAGYVLEVDQSIRYEFRAELLALNHWHIDGASIQKSREGKALPLDAASLIIELQPILQMDREMLPVYLEEISATLYGAAYKHDYQRLTSAELARGDFQDIESSMTAGHPCFIANSGRIGFDGRDFLAHAPEAASPVRVVWLAGRRDRTTFSAVSGYSYEQLLQDELGPELIASFCAHIEAQGLDPNDYILFPVHPWQWSNKLITAFAGELGTRALLFLGESEDLYLAQQSIRTLFNVSQPARHYVKSALSILNMGFMRGLSPLYMAATPAICEWVDELTRSDPQLRRLGFETLRELASVGYRHPMFEQGAPDGSAYKKMLAMLWRESPCAKIEPHQRLMTMASLLHVDSSGVSLVAQLISASGIAIDDWLGRYLRAYLTPLLHCFYAYDLVFMPHGENVILVFNGAIPVRAFMKDIAEEVCVLNKDAIVSKAAQRVVVDGPEEMKLLSIFTDVFDCFFRFLVPLLYEHCGYAEDSFWRVVAECVLDYQRAHPELQDKFERYDLFAPEFALSCLNRLQLKNNRQMVNLTDPFAALTFAGSLSNPLAPYGLGAARIGSAE